jgi:FHS family L-fucose permease-like MFS transporter
MLELPYADALLIQLVYYAGHLLFAWPATVAMAQLGALRASAAGLVVMAIGCALLAAAQGSMSFPSLLAALLLLSAGVTVLQIACNGAMATLGGGTKAASRFTLLQGFNALGTVVGPLSCAQSLLSDHPGAPPHAVFVAFAIGFGVLGAAFAANHFLLPDHGTQGMPAPARLARLIAVPRVAHGVAAIFAYVGAEVTIGSLAVSYLMLPDRAHVGPVEAGRLVSLYWGGAMIGRFAGAWAIARFGTARLLAVAAYAAVALLTVAIVARGAWGSAALLATGLCNSIMFPAIYALAMPNEADDVPATAMLLCMAVVGGAVVPMLTGILADRATLVGALVIPVLCYAGIALFARGAQARA